MLRLAGFGLFLAVSVLNMFQETVPQPPVAKKIEKITRIHDETIVDRGDSRRSLGRALGVVVFVDGMDRAG